MDQSRLRLHEELCEVLGSRNVYFQPPETLKMRYPCIIYSINNIRTRFADNSIYALKKEYAVTVVDANSDNDTALRLLSRLPLCSFSRRYTANNLTHDVLTLFY